ncbi:FG-GAP-like repeat-containing protein [Streptomyces sp. NPDC023838]|uniref:FG-GAP-like repeat-containing protein n=1 Tax=Streptomyces sp. NPDC023838 TaxID=3154325 RepID=UPI0033DE2682
MTIKSSRHWWTIAVLATTMGSGILTTPPASALSGSDVPTDTYTFTTKLNVGENSACSGALVDPQWVLTAASCFIVDGKTAPAGKPGLKVTVTVGRTDLTKSGGVVVEAVEVVPHADRDLMMVKLARRVAAAPVKLAATAPTAGEQLTSVGFGRTKTEWVPDKLHSGAFTVSSVGSGAVALNGSAGAVICQGDAGGPALRVKNGSVELAAVNSRSWRGGCLGTDAAETRTGAVDVRVDDLGAWVTSLTSRRSAAVNEAGGNDRVRWADFDGDRRPDYLTVADNGNVEVYLNRGGDGHGGWEGLGKVAMGLTNDRNRVRFADWDGDGKADYLLINTDGSVEAYLNQGGDGHGGWNAIGKIARGTTTDPGKVRFADWDGDGRTDYLTFNDSGAVTAYLNRGGDLVPNSGWDGIGQITTGASSDRSRVRFADNDGDGKADYYLVKPDGKVDLYLNRGGDLVPNTGWQGMGQIATGLTTDHTKVQFVDFDADTHADYVLAGTAGSATVFAWNGGDGHGGWTDLGKVASGA